MANAEEAAELAATIRSGALPFRLVATKVDSISLSSAKGR